MQKQRILIVEDEPKIVQVLKDYLVEAEYEVSTIDRGDIVFTHVEKYPPDLILLDIMLPGLDGRSVCKGIRDFSSVPIIMITARVEETDRLIGLELGADDYICKPFSPREVVARVRAVLRRTSPQNTQKRITVGPITLDAELRFVTINDEELVLTPNEFSLLKTMLANPNRAFTRSELVSTVQGYDFDGYDRTIDSHIKNLRKKIAALLPDQEVISSLYGVGYKLKG